jgi:hypothetical protein
MTTPNEFWLRLHQLAAGYGAEGDTTSERAESIVGELCAMPTVARLELLEDLLLLATHLPDLHALSLSAVRAM